MPATRIYPPTSERLLAACIPEPNSGCWLWLGAAIKESHGRVRGKIYHQGKQQLAPRVSWKIFRCDIADEINVLHTCDTPECVNPDHLFLGSQLDNVKDMDAKGRRVTRPPSGLAHWSKSKPEALLRGEAAPRAKLSLPDVVTIRKLARSGTEILDLAARYSVGESAIRRCILGQTFGLPEIRLPSSRARKMPRGQSHHNAKITDAQRSAIELDTRSSTVIAKEYGITFSTVCRIRAKARAKLLAQTEAEAGGQHAQ